MEGKVEGRMGRVVEGVRGIERLNGEGGGGRRRREEEEIVVGDMREEVMKEEWEGCELLRR